MTTETELSEKIASARRSIDEAEQDLDRLLSDLADAPRAEKTTITPVLEAAFQKLRKARANLGELEHIVLGLTDRDSPKSERAK